MKKSSVVAFALATFALMACGGGGHSSGGSLPATGGGGSATSTTVPDLSANSPHNAAAAPGAVTSNVSIAIPLATQTASTRRRSQYLTSYTLGIDLQDFQNGVYSGYVFYPIGAGQSNCTTAATTLSCTLSIQAPPGNSQILVHTYDGTAMATSNVLSVAAAPETIVAAQTNNVTITTNPIAANFQLANNQSLPNCTILGTPINISTTYTTFDADGGSLAGLTLGNTITFGNLNTNDTTGGFAITPSVIASGSGPIAFTYNGSDTNIYIQSQIVSLTSKGLTNVQAGGLTALMPIQTAGPHYIFFSTPANNTIGVFDMCASNFGANAFIRGYSLPAGTNPQTVEYDRQSPPGDPRVFVLGGTPNNRLLFVDIGNSPPSGGAAVVLQTLTPGGTPHSIKNASTSPVAFVSYGTNSVTRYATNETGPTYLTAGATNASFNNPNAIGFAATGSYDIFVTNTNSGQILGVNNGSLAVDSTLTVGGTPSSMSGPNSSNTCNLATDHNGALLYGVSPELTGTATMAQIGSTMTLPGLPFGATFFPATTSTTGSGINTDTAFVSMPGVAAIVSCNGSALSQVATWTAIQNPAGSTPATGNFTPSIMSNPASLSSSNFASNVIPGLIYVVGLDQGVAVFYAYSQFSKQPVIWLQNIDNGNAMPSSVSEGP